MTIYISRPRYPCRHCAAMFSDPAWRDSHEGSCAGSEARGPTANRMPRAQRPRCSHAMDEARLSRYRRMKEWAAAARLSRLRNSVPDWFNGDAA